MADRGVHISEALAELILSSLDAWVSDAPSTLAATGRDKAGEKLRAAMEAQANDDGTVVDPVRALALREAVAYCATVSADVVDSAAAFEQFLRAGSRKPE